MRAGPSRVVMAGTLDVGAWLEGLGLGQYRDLFARQQIDSEVLQDLTDADLLQLEIPLGHRKRLLRALGRAPTQPAPASPVGVAPGAQRRHLTILFCDMVGSTLLASRLDPEDLRNIMRPFFDRCGEIIQGMGGHLARYMGDGVLAYFGYPQAQEDAAERAVRVGCQFVEHIPRMQNGSGSKLNMRVGIASGLVVVGDVLGEGAAREEAVIGEIPAVAARLQALGSPGDVLIADATRRLLGRRFTLEDAGRHDLKNLSGPVQVWRVTGERAVESRYVASRSSAASPLVGRNEEIAALIECWRSACDGNGQVVHLSGVGGVGKSRLVRALRERIRREQHAIMVLQCSPFHVSTALYPIAARLQRAAGFVGGESAEQRLQRLRSFLQAQGLTAELPLFAQLLAIPSDGADVPAAEAKQRVLDAVVGWLLRSSRAMPTLVMLEDAHWADPTTLELLRLAASKIIRERILVVVTSRPEFEPAWPDDIVPVSLRLLGLDPAQTTALAETVAGVPLPPELLQQICARTDGVPLFVEELTKAVVEANARAEPSLVPRHAAIPASLQDTLLARLDALGASGREVAQVAAVIGREFSHALLRQVADIPEAELVSSIAALEKAGIVRGSAEPGGGIYMFRHGLLQETAYNTLLHSTRRELHGRIAVTLEEHFADAVASQPALLAHHFTEADVPPRAIHWWQLAAERSRRQSANVEATLQYQRALELLQRVPEAAERDRYEIMLRTQLNPAIYAAMGPAAAERGANFAKLVELHARLGDTARMFPVMWGQCVVSFARCELTESTEKTREYLRLAEDRGDPVVQTAGHLHLGHTELLRGAVGPGLESVDRALALYRPEHRSTLISDYALDLHSLALSCRCLALQQLGQTQQAARLAEEAAQEAKQGGHFVTISHVLFQVALSHMIAGDVAATEESARELAIFSERHQGVYWRSHADILQGWAIAQAGRIDEGLARMREGTVRRARMQGRAWEPQYVAQEADLLTSRGRTTEALRRLDEADALINATDHRVSEAELHRQRALALAAEGAPDADVEAWLCSALSLARARGQVLWASRAAADLAAHRHKVGDEAGVAALLEEVTAWMARRSH
ncbi:MAG TPA: adenylate/guanylate cyclase domain-containing protein [Acetobacteraceae bacterium]|jgi:class 3 adenylate cyclase/predicted ATPase